MKSILVMSILFVSGFAQAQYWGQSNDSLKNITKNSSILLKRDLYISNDSTAIQSEDGKLSCNLRAVNEKGVQHKFPVLIPKDTYLKVQSASKREMQPYIDVWFITKLNNYIVMTCSDMKIGHFSDLVSREGLSLSLVQAQQY